MKTNTIYNEDCIGEKGMRILPDNSINMVLADIPYGTTACKWDKIIPLKPLWKQLKRVIKPNGAIVLTASQPFTSRLVMSNLKMFKYCWVWEKDNTSNPMLCNIQPMKYHEDIAVFGKSKIKFNPQKWDAGKLSNKGGVGGRLGMVGKIDGYKNNSSLSKMRYPKSIIYFGKPKHNSNEGLYHSTQKPVALMEYLIKTYTNENDIVLDFAIGSGTTAVACVNLGRHYIGYETDKDYVRIANKRLSEVQLSLL